MTHVVELPFPPATLSPNARKHWALRARIAKGYRQTCRVLAQEQGVRDLNATRLRVNVNICPPDLRRRDDDNMIGAFKAGRDGLADALCVDDGNWDVSYTITKDKSGRVIVTVEEVDP